MCLSGLRLHSVPSGLKGVDKVTESHSNCPFVDEEQLLIAYAVQHRYPFHDVALLLQLHSSIIQELRATCFSLHLFRV